MPVRLIGTIILLLLVTIFSGLNLDNKCDINFFFTKFEQIPVFITVISSFAVGAILMIPFTFSFFHKRNKKNEKSEKDENKTQSEEKTTDLKKTEEVESKTLFDFKIKKDTPKDKNKETK